MKQKKRKLKVLYIATAFPRNSSDPITPWLTKTIEKLNNKNVKIDVFTSAYKGLIKNKIANIDVFRFRYFIRPMENLTHEEMTLERMKKGIIYKILPIFYILFGIIGILNHCRMRKYDLIHIHWPFPHFIFGYIAKKVCKCPIISTFHSAELHLAKNSKINIGFFIKWVVNNSDTLTVNSSYTGKELNKYKPKNIKIVPFGTAIETKEKQKISKTKKGIRILFVGRLVERKGVQYLLEACKILKQKGTKNIQVIIVGDGNRKNYLINKRKELELSKFDVEFKGKISEPELIKQYRLCDIFVLPAIIDSGGDTEGLGVVLLEAMSFRKPVIASNVGGIIDIVKDKKTGLLTKEKSSEELASAIEFLINNPEERKRLAKKGYKFQKENFSWESITSSLISIYEKLT